MQRSRRVLFRILGSVCWVAGRGWSRQFPPEQDPSNQRPHFPRDDEDTRLPDGRSQKNAIAKERHEQALKDADELVGVSEKLRDELKAAGMFVVPLNSVKRTEEIEKLARRIRGRLKS